MKTFLVFLILSANTFAAKNTNVQTRWQELFYLVNQEIKVLENAKNKGQIFATVFLNLIQKNLNLFMKRIIMNS